MKRKLNKRSVALLVSLAVILTAAVGVTLAYIFTNTDALQNIFTPAQVSCAVVENGNPGKEFGQVTGISTKTNVQIQNTGNTNAYIRVAVVFTWKNADGTVYAKLPVKGTDYQIEYDLNNGWVQKGEYFYYTLPVAPMSECSHGVGATSCDKCFTKILIKSCEVLDTAVPPAEGYQLSVEIVASAVQSAPSDTVGKAWGVVIAEKSVTEYAE